jgi:hypothetical protein
MDVSSYWFVFIDEFDVYDDIISVNSYDEVENMLTTFIFHIVFIDYRVVDKYKKIAEILYQRGLSTKIRVFKPTLKDEEHKSQNDHNRNDEKFKAKKKEVLIVDDLIIDPNLVRVTFKGDEIKLTGKEFDLLYCLAKYGTQVLSYDDIFELVWGDNDTHGDDIIKAHLHRLRKKLSITNREYIKNVRGKGYRFSK